MCIRDSPDIDERAAMSEAVTSLQAVTDLPLQLDSNNASVLESAMRRYNGKPLVNSVNGEKASMDAVFPLVKKYGGTVIALTMDKKGIPETADGRVKIALRIVKYAEKYGIKPVSYTHLDVYKRQRAYGNRLYRAQKQRA